MMNTSKVTISNDVNLVELRGLTEEKRAVWRGPATTSQRKRNPTDLTEKVCMAKLYFTPRPLSDFKALRMQLFAYSTVFFKVAKLAFGGSRQLNISIDSADKSRLPKVQGVVVPKLLNLCKFDNLTTSTTYLALIITYTRAHMSRGYNQLFYIKEVVRVVG